jgi:hypothetical protein
MEEYMSQQNPNFPIPENLEGFWVWDKMHGPRPMTPYTQDLIPRTCMSTTSVRASPEG